MDKRILENLRVRKALVEGYFDLLKKYQNDKISISMIAEQAGVSRMAYYRNFDSKNDIIQYFLEMVFEEIKSQLSSECRFWSREYGYVFLKVMKKYRKQFLLLDEAGFIGMVQTMRFRQSIFYRIWNNSCVRFNGVGKVIPSIRRLAH